MKSWRGIKVRVMATGGAAFMLPPPNFSRAHKMAPRADACSSLDKSIGSPKASAIICAHKGEADKTTARTD